MSGRYDEIEKKFVDGRKIILWDHYQDLYDKVRRFLNNRAERDFIATNAAIKSLAEHATSVRAWLYELDKAGTLRFKKTVVAMVARAKTMAVQRDACAESKAHPFFSSFTTGFGIVAHK